MPLSAIYVDAMIKMVISKRFILMLLSCQVKDVGKSDELTVGKGLAWFSMKPEYRFVATGYFSTFNLSDTGR